MRAASRCLSAGEVSQRLFLSSVTHAAGNKVRVRVRVTPISILERSNGFLRRLDKFFLACSCHQSITTHASIDEHEAAKAFDDSIKEVCNIYIAKLFSSGKLQDAIYLLRHLGNRQISLNLNTHNILLTAASEANNFDLFSKIFKNLLLSRSPPDSTSYINVVRAFQKVTNSDLLLDFVREISEITSPRDPTVMNRIIFNLAKSGQITTCMMIYEDLKNRRRKMDVVMFNTVLAILGKGGQVDRMLCEFLLMKEFGYAPDIVSYNTMINCFRRLGRLDLCLVFLREMSEAGMEPDLRTYTAIIDGFGRAGLVDDVLRVFGEMKKCGVRPSIYVYRALISDLKKAGKLKLADSYLEEMKSSVFKLVGPEDFKRKKRNYT